MNFQFQRNPQRLLTLQNLIQPNQQAEEKFLQNLFNFSQNLQPLWLVVGGFMDQYLGHGAKVAHGLDPHLKTADIYFREYYEIQALCKLTQIYAHFKQPINLIAHSWGADAVVNSLIPKINSQIDFLLTLDPVSYKGPPAKRPPQIKYWANIHVDYPQTKLLNPSNLIARIGNPWQTVIQADLNLTAPATVTHDQAWTLFTLYCQSTAPDSSLYPIGQL